MTLTTLYLITMLPHIGRFIGGISMFLFASAFGMVSNFQGPFCKKDGYSKAIKVVVFACILAAISILIPSENDLYLIAGGYAATNTAGIEKLPANVVAAANAYLEKMAKEGKW